MITSNKSKKVDGKSVALTLKDVEKKGYGEGISRPYEGEN